MTFPVLLLRAEVLQMRLRDLGIVTPQQLEKAKQELSTTQERMGVLLARQGILRDPDAVKRIAAQLGAVPVRIEVPPQLPEVVGKVPIAVWAGYRLVPITEQEGTVLLATDDPLSVFMLESLGRRCGCAFEVVYVAQAQFATLLLRLEEGNAGVSEKTQPAAQEPVMQKAPPVLAAQPKAETSPAPLASAPRVSAETGDEPIIKLVDSMLREAVHMRASDIHLQPSAEDLRVRYRVDGVLRDVNTSPKALQGSIISRIKIMSGLNIAEKRLPQDGRLQLLVDERPLDVRISTLPATHGESIVMRLLDRSQPVRGLSEMGMSEAMQKQWDEFIHRPHGMVLVTGPTGSGKTTTLYGALSKLNAPDRKLITIEDPVEYQLAGVNQVLVRSGIGLSFAAGLRSMLRQAPDVIMVGEIRDHETAQISIQAALTGHLVLSTLHTNDAPSAITRLVDMGIAPFLAASTVQGVLAQRLVRRICRFCRMTADATEEERRFLGSKEPLQLIHSVGCDQCRGSGFLGRVGIFELLAVTNNIRKLIVSQATASQIRQAALKEGMQTLRDDGCQKIRDGLTTLQEVLRVVSAMDIDG